MFFKFITVFEIQQIERALEYILSIEFECIYRSAVRSINGVILGVKMKNQRSVGSEEMAKS